MRRLAFFALGAAALCAVAFSPGPEVLLAVTVIVLTAALCVLAVPWLKSPFISHSAAYSVTGHGNGPINLRADGLGAGGRHGPPHIIAVLVILTLWALIVAICSRVGHAVTKLGASAGHIMARTNTAAQPLPS